MHQTNKQHPSRKIKINIVKPVNTLKYSKQVNIIKLASQHQTHQAPKLPQESISNIIKEHKLPANHKPPKP